MMKSQSLALMLLSSLVVLGAIMANENPIQTGPGSKLKIIDNSRVLTPEEVDKLPNKNELPVVVPLLKSPSAPAIQPKIGIVVNNEEKIAKKLVDEKAADVVADLNKQDESSVKLPPIPLIMPSFLNSVFEQNDDSSYSGAATGDENSKPKGFMNVLVLRSQRVEDSSNPEGGIKSSVVIMRYLPKSVGSFFGMGGEQAVDSEQPQNMQKLLGGGDNDVDKKRIHLLGGGDDDVDKKRIHLFGGDDDVDMKRMHMMGGEGDPDHNGGRIELDESNKGVFTGGNEDVFANSDQHRIFVFSMFDRLRSMFDNMRQSFEQQIPSFSPSSSSENNEPNNLEAAVPFISIRTDDGQSALIPNDIGYAEKQQHEQSLNKCMMLQFMRLKASMYYRTILHLLFFTGVLLFIFSLVMLMLRACRRRQLTRRLPHHHHRSNMSIASIESGKSSKLAAYKAWQGMDQSSLIDSDKIVLIQAPPAYDQVYIQDKNSTLTTGVVPRPSFADACQTTDECETKSLPPPEYELAKQ